MALKPFLEAEDRLKVWHNYGFDRHVIWNHGVDVRGLGGDTMHLARLWTRRERLAVRSSRLSPLHSPLSLFIFIRLTHACMHARARRLLEALTDELLQRRKVPMKEIFGIPKLKRDGTPGACTCCSSIISHRHAPHPSTHTACCPLTPPQARF